MRNTYNASSVTPYNPAETLGDVTPSTPQATPPKKQKCGGFGQIFLAIIAIAVTVMLPGGGFIGSAISGAIGSIVSQTIGVAIGIQDKFSWKAVAMAAITAGVDGGLANKFGTGFTAAVVRSAASSAISQGINVALGLQDKFSWAAVAASAVGAGVGHKVGNSAMLSKASGQVVKAAVSTTTMLTNAATRSLIDGSDFGDNVLSALPSVLGSMIFDGLVSLIPKASEEKFTQTASIADTTMTDAGPSYGGARGAASSQAKPIETIIVTAFNQSTLGKAFKRLQQYAYDLQANLTNDSRYDFVRQGIRVGLGAYGIQGGRRQQGTAQSSLGFSQIVARVSDPTPNPFGTLGNLFAPGLRDSTNIRGSFNIVNARSRVAMNGGDPFERGLASSGLAQEAMNVGSNAMVASLMHNASNEIAGNVAGGMVGGIFGKVTGLGGRAVAQAEGRIIAANSSPIRIARAGDPDFIGPIKPQFIRGSSESWGSYLTRMKGPPPEGMIDPHAHHVVFQTGNGAAQQALVVEGQGILRAAGIDPISGPENLVWAPMRVTGQHGQPALNQVVTELREAQQLGLGRDALVDILTRNGKLAAARK